MQPQAVGRLFWSGVALAIGFVGLVQLSWLTAHVYDGFAREQRARKSDSRAALSASVIAARLAPWEASFHLSAARSLSAVPQTAAATAEVGEALRWVSADAHVWTEAAMILTQAGVSDARLLAVTQRAVATAPTTRATQTGLALSGLRYWDVGDEAQHEQWRKAIRFSFEHDRERLLRDAVRFRVENRICADRSLGLPAQKFPRNWCVAVSLFRGNCIRDDLTPEHRASCISNGYRVQPKLR